MLLYITDLHHISDQELVIFEQMYQESRQDSTRLESQYELVWIPVVEKGTAWAETKQKFERLQSMMPWYSVYEPSLLEAATIRYIKEVWLFNTKPMLVVLDPQGKLVNLNAVHMMWIWGSMAYPFSSLREEALWKEETWGLALLADTIDPLLFDWVRARFFILYMCILSMFYVMIINVECRYQLENTYVCMEGMIWIGSVNSQARQNPWQELYKFHLK